MRLKTYKTQYDYLDEEAERRIIEYIMELYGKH